MNQKLMLTTFVGIVLLSNLVLAVPGIPNAFYGTVTWNGSPAPDGTTVVAKINGVEVARTTTRGGKYGYNPIFYVDDPNSDRSGSTINFFVNDVNTGKTAIFTNGKVTLLDLSASGATTTTIQPSSGGPYIPPQTTTTTQPTTNQTTTTTTVCQERWICTEWSACVNGLQTRTCNDENNCGTDLYKPLESQPCTPTTSEGGNQPTGGTTGLPITGFFAALTGNTLYIGIILVIVIVAIVLFLKRKPLIKRHS